MEEKTTTTATSSQKSDLIDEFQQALKRVLDSDLEGLIEAQNEYGESWCARGGQGAFFTLVRPLDRLLVLASKTGTDRRVAPYDIFEHCLDNPASGEEGPVLNTVRDLRRYLTLVEVYLVRRGHSLPLQRHNVRARSRKG